MADPLALDDLYDLRTPTHVAVSPDGRRVAIVVREADPDADDFRRSLFVAPADGRRPPHRLTRLGDAHDPRWSPAGDRLAFLATRERDAGDSDTETQLWTLDLALGGDARQVTAFDEGVREFDWSPDGERVVVSARDPTPDQQEYRTGVRERGDPYEVTRLQHKREGVGFLDDVRSRLFVLAGDATGATRETATRLDDAYGRGALEASTGLHPAWGPADRIAYVAYYGDDPDATQVLDVHTVAPDGSDRRTLTGGDVTATDLRWSPAGDRLAFLAGHPTNTYHPTEVHVADPGGAVRSVSASLDRTAVGTPRWVDDRTLLAPVGDEGRTRLVRLDSERDAPERVFDVQGAGRTTTAVDANGATTALVFSHPSEGVDVFALPTADIDADTPPTRLTALNDDLLADVALPTCERIRFENGDGDTVEGLVYLPAGFDSENGGQDPLPLICHVHGGPAEYDAPAFSFDYAYWTGQGYAVLTVNYRGSTSYGRAFSERIRGDWGPREVDDILSGVDAVVDRDWVDPDRLFLGGFSQGAINTLYAVTRDDRFVAAAPEQGIYDFSANFGVADTQVWYADEFGLPWEHEAGYRSISSLVDVDGIDTPLLITAAEDDHRCPPTHAEQLHVSAKRAGVESKLVVYQDERHDITRPKRHVHRLETITGWFEDHDPAVDSSDPSCD